MIWQIVFIIFFFTGATTVVVMHLVKMIFKFKCRDIQQCQNSKCRMRGSCEKAVMTDEEMQEIYALIEKMGSDQEEGEAL